MNYQLIARGLLSRQSLVLIVGMLCAVALTTIAFVNTARLVPLAVTDVSQNDSKTAQTPVVVINLTRFGFEPDATEVPAGKYQFAIRNISGLENIDLQVTRKTGERVLVEKYPTGREYWEKILQLPVGDYVVSVVSNPQWVFSLAVVVPPAK